MTYLYGNSKPFPYNSNFIDTVQALIRTCSDLLVIDEQIEKLEKSLEHLETAEVKMNDVLNAFSTSICDAIDNYRDRGLDDVIYQTLTESLKTAVGHQVSGFVTSRKASFQADISEVQHAISAQRQRIAGLCASLLVNHEIPHTEWFFYWSYRARDNNCVATAVSRHECGIVARYSIDLDRIAHWKTPPRVDDFVDYLEADVARPKKLSGEMRVRTENLTRYFVTEVMVSPETFSVKLRRSNKDRSPGVDISINNGGEEFAQIQWVDTDAEASPSHPVSAANLPEIEQFWQHVLTTLRSAKDAREQLSHLTIGKTDASNIKRPSDIVEILLDQFSPITKLISEYSRQSEELVLKKALENGHREEIFVAIRHLCELTSAVSIARRTVFFKLGIAGFPWSRDDLKQNPDSKELPESDGPNSPYDSSMTTASSKSAGISPFRKVPLRKPTIERVLAKTNRAFPEPTGSSDEQKRSDEHDEVVIDRIFSAIQSNENEVPSEETEVTLPSTGTDQ